MSHGNNHQSQGNGDKNPPTHVAKVRHGTGRQASYERVGVAWINREDDTVYIRLYGTQVIDRAITCYPIEERQ